MLNCVFKRSLLSMAKKNKVGLNVDIHRKIPSLKTRNNNKSRCEIQIYGTGGGVV
jgi:hypothetical protein